MELGCGLSIALSFELLHFGIKGFRSFPQFDSVAVVMFGEIVNFHPLQASSTFDFLQPLAKGSPSLLKPIFLFISSKFQSCDHTPPGMQILWFLTQCPERHPSSKPDPWFTSFIVETTHLFLHNFLVKIDYILSSNSRSPLTFSLWTASPLPKGLGCGLSNPSHCYHTQGY